MTSAELKLPSQFEFDPGSQPTGSEVSQQPDQYTKAHVTNAKIERARARIALHQAQHQARAVEIVSDQAALGDAPNATVQEKSAWQQRLAKVGNIARTVADKTGEFLAWTGVGLVIRGSVNVGAAALDWAGKPIAVAGAVAVRTVRDWWVDQHDYRDRGGRYFFAKNAGDQAYQTLDQDGNIRHTNPESFWGATKRALRTLNKGLVEKTLRKHYQTDQYAQQLQDMLHYADATQAEIVHLATQRYGQDAADSQAVASGLVQEYRTAKLALDTATTHDQRTQSRSVLKKLYGAVDELTQGDQPLRKQLLQKMQASVNDQLDQSAYSSMARVRLDRVLHTPFTAALPALVGATLFEEYVAKTEWYQQAKAYCSDKAHKAISYLGQRAQTLFKPPSIELPQAETPRGGGKVLASIAPPELPEAPAVVTSQPVTAPSEQPVRVTSSRVMFAPEDLGADTYVVPTVKEVFVPTQFTTQEGQGLFVALNKAGFRVTEQSARVFLDRIGVPVFNLSAEQIAQLQHLIDQNPNISAHDLRTVAIAQGIDFDDWFRVGIATYDIPPVVSQSEIALDEGLAIGASQARAATPATDDGLFYSAAFSPAPAPLADGPKPEGIPLRTRTRTLPLAGATATQGGGLALRSGGRLPLAGANVATQGEGIRLASSGRLPIAQVDVQPAASSTTGASVPERLPVTPVDVVAQPPVVLREPIRDWYTQYDELDYDSVRAFGLDWSPGRMSNISISSNTFNFNGRDIKLFRYEEIGLTRRSWNQDLSTEMKGKLTEDWVQYDPNRGNIWMQVHASGNTHAESTRVAVEGVNAEETVPPMGSEEILENMSALVSARPTISLNQDGRQVTFELTDMFNARINPRDALPTHTEPLVTGADRIGMDPLDYMYSHRGNYFNYFDMVQGRNKLYVVFCGASYYQGIDYLKALSITDPNFTNAIDGLSASGQDYQTYAAHLGNIIAWLEANDRNSHAEFMRLIMQPTTSYSHLSHTRYIMEFTPRIGR